MNKTLYLAVITLTVSLSAGSAMAQDGQDPFLFSTQAIKFSTLNSPQSASTLFNPSVASANGFSSFLDNPASVALFENGFFTAGYNVINQNEDDIFLGNEQNFDNSQGLLSDLGFVYKAPVKRGSLVFGAGYSLQSNFERGTRLDARNELSTITDVFKQDGFFPLEDDIAFQTFATDYGDAEQTFVESIFRIGVPDFRGITQTAEIKQSGYLGEYSAFIGTEFQRNFFVGVSLGITAGNYSYERTFIESDEFNDYDDEFIDVDGDGVFETDVDNIVLTDDLDSELFGFTARVGAIYKLSPFINIGGSYTLPSTVDVTEEASTSIVNNFDDGQALEGSLFFETKYDVKRPGKLSGGISFTELGPVSISAAVDYIDYSQTEIEFDDAELLDEEIFQNQVIEDVYQDVINLRVGGTFKINEQSLLRAGYSFLPGRSKEFEADRNIFGGGVSFAIQPNVILDISGQYSIWDDRSIIYQFQDERNFPNNSLTTETADEDVNRFELSIGLKVLF